MTRPRIGSLCSGYGGLDAAVLQVLGGSVAWHADNDPAAAKVLAAHWPAVPNHGDITTTDWATVEPIDVLTAGYPCQPDSAAGKRLGAADDRWIWPAVRDAIRDLGPRLVVLENVRGHLGRGFPTVVGDLADVGYDTRWCCVPASAVGAPHRRDRLFALAYPADPADDRRQRRGPARRRGDGSTHGRLAPAHTGGPGLEIGRLEHHGPQRPTTQRSHPEPAAHPDSSPVRQQPEPITGSSGPAGAGLDRRATADTAGDGLVRDTGSPRRGAACGSRERVAGGGAGGLAAVARWGKWASAIKRWERAIRPAPDPVELGRRGNRRLNPAFSEWMMGIPAGWVTAMPGLSRNDQLRLIGNGVVPQQAVAALRWLLDCDERAAAS